MGERFNPERLERLNSPERLEIIPPGYIWNFLEPGRHTDKVEIGAGTGIFCRAFQKISGTGKTTAVDVSDVMIDWMNENIVPQNPEIIPVLANGKDLPLETESADLVYMITVHHELDDPAETLSEAYRILRTGGSILIADWNGKDPKHGPKGGNPFTSADVAAQLKNAGFTNIRTDDSLAKIYLAAGIK